MNQQCTNWNKVNLRHKFEQHFFCDLSYFQPTSNMHSQIRTWCRVIKIVGARGLFHKRHALFSMTRITRAPSNSVSTLQLLKYNFADEHPTFKRVWYQQILLQSPGLYVWRVITFVTNGNIDFFLPLFGDLWLCLAAGYSLLTADTSQHLIN